jgi:ParB-like chromosome segregation protein Spo0J
VLAENSLVTFMESNMQIDFFENKSILEKCKELFKLLEKEPIQVKVDLINDIREELHKYSPFNTEPVDFVRWIKNDLVQANDYNPNSVAPPEMKLLEHSISEDGYTQPIVSWSRDGIFEVVDGFHRHRVGKESGIVCSRVHGYLPAVVINGSRQNKNDRMASTIRHNRARGEHKVESMSEIVVELKRRFWSDEKIAKELGMEADEVLRLQQVTGLSGLFADSEFSEAWEAETFEEVEGVDELSE